VYGNSVQNGTSTPDVPVEIKSVGDKTKNLFDKGHADIFVGYLTLSAPVKPFSSSTGNSLILKIKSNTTYTISKLADTKFRVATFTEYPTTSTAATVWDTTHNTVSSLTIQSGANDIYMMVFYFDGTTTNTEEAITLPTINTTTGINILDVDTLIKPSKVDITYR
jgi:hypothetical protein